MYELLIVIKVINVTMESVYRLVTVMELVGIVMRIINVILFMSVEITFVFGNDL